VISASQDRALLTANIDHNKGCLCATMQASPALGHFAFCLGSERVCGVRQEVMSRRGAPGVLRMDNGPEFIALALRGLCSRKGISAAHIEPGKPWHRVPFGRRFAESFHSR
jgi:hypothetical protein